MRAPSGPATTVYESVQAHGTLRATGDATECDAMERDAATLASGRFIASLPTRRHDEALALLRRGAYWLEQVSDDVSLRWMRAPSVMVGAIDSADRLIANARVVADAKSLVTHGRASR